MSLDALFDDKKEEKKEPKPAPKIVPTKEAVRTVIEDAKKMQDARKERNKREYERLERMSRPEKIEIDSNKVYMKLRSMDIEEFPIYDVIIRRAKSGRKHSYLESYINFINRYFKELMRDD